jgi:hypothetical protein
MVIIVGDIKVACSIKRDGGRMIQSRGPRCTTVSGKANGSGAGND